MPDIPQEKEEEAVAMPKAMVTPPDATWTLLNLDSGDLIPLDPPVWQKDALLSDEVMAWLDEVIATLEDPSSLERSVDLQDLWEDMSVEEYEQLFENVLNEGV